MYPNHHQVDKHIFLPQLPGKWFGMQRKPPPQITSADVQDSLKKGGVAVSKCTLKRHCMVESPEESHYYVNATKYPVYNTPRSTDTSLKLLEPKMNFLAKNIWRGINRVKGSPFLL